MDKINIYQVDSFTGQAFKGNPAGVCILKEELSDGLMQSIASEMNLSETAFCIPQEGIEFDKAERFDLRWFTPAVEVNLCGHATLATAKILYDEYKNHSQALHFFTRSGELIVEKTGGKLCMNFPADPTDEIEIPGDALDALGIEKPAHTASSRNLRMKLIEVESPEIVKNLKPNFGNLEAIGEKFENFGFLVTSRWGEDGFDIISRFFAPVFGIPEDPVTGAAHTVLGPYWAAKLGKSTIRSYQASARGGDVTVVVKGDRVDLIGEAVVVIKGEIHF
ncbi:MAG: PhzF family phenazine biosynthesis protein [Candidatus Zixiibacteriota bacterium]|nr:MAG: PhzF family phenazine biosynthesis protein [candidate division Zixibacteria bacterium]